MARWNNIYKNIFGLHMDEYVNNLPQEDTQPLSTKPVEEVPRFWEAIKILGNALVIYVLFYIVFLAASTIFKFPKSLYEIYMTVMAAYGVFLILKWTFKGGYDLEKTFRFFTIPSKCILPLVIIGLGLSLIQLHVLTMFVISSSTAPPDRIPENQILLTLLLKIILPIIFSITIFPIAEELICRGILLSSIEKQWGLKVAIVVTSVFFGIMHFKYLKSISISIVFMLVAWLVYKANSILCGILIHFLHNAITLIYSILYVSGILNDYILFTAVYPWSFDIIALLIYIAIVIIGVWWFKKMLNLSSQHPITFISDYFRRKNELCKTSSLSSETIDQ